ncbi:hypothetical protein M3Y99_00099000 [Aphelenchoides fujianensis]|nr:hypothetical protein M3Y99_00099000 [Aphelenchoides fujianensis]
MSQPTAPKREAPSAESEVRPPVQPPPKKSKKNEQEPKRGARLRDEFDRLRALIDERRPGAPPCRASDQADVLEKARALIVETEQRAKFYELLFYAARFEATNRVQRAALLGFRMGAHFLYQRQHLGQPQLNAQMTALDEAADGMGVRMPPVPAPLPNWAAFFAPPVQPSAQPLGHSFDASMPPVMPQQPTVSHGHAFYQPHSQPMPLPIFPPTSVPWMPFVNAPMIPPTHQQQQEQPQLLQPIVPHASTAAQQFVLPPIVPPTPLKPAAVSQQPAIAKPLPLTARQQAAAAVPPTPKKPRVGLPPLVLPSAVQQPAAIPIALKPPPIRRIVLNAIPPRVALAERLVPQQPAAAPTAPPVAAPAVAPPEEAAPAPVGQQEEAAEADARPIGPVPPPPPPSPALQQPKESPPPTPTPPFVPTASTAASSSSSFPSHVFEDPAFQASAAAGFGQNGGQIPPFVSPNFNNEFAASIQNVLNSFVAEEGGSESSGAAPQ